MHHHDNDDPSNNDVADDDDRSTAISYVKPITLDDLADYFDRTSYLHQWPQLVNLDLDDDKANDDHPAKHYHAGCDIDEYCTNVDCLDDDDG